MTALSAYQAKAELEFPGLRVPIDEDGTEIWFRSAVMLSDEKTALVEDLSDRLNALNDQDDQDLVKQRALFVDFLTTVADDSKLAATVLADLPLGVISLIFQDYSDTVSDATKSEDDPESPEGS